MATAKIFTTGGSQAVRLPKEFRFEGKEILIHRDGRRVILEPKPRAAWPKGFFRSIRIDDDSFARPPQGELPPTPDLDAR